MDAEALVRRAQARCKQHMPGKGHCSDCFLEELEEVLLEQNPELCRGDAFELV